MFILFKPFLYKVYNIYNINLSLCRIRIYFHNILVLGLWKYLDSLFNNGYHLEPDKENLRNLENVWKIYFVCFTLS